MIVKVNVIKSFTKKRELGNPAGVIALEANETPLSAAVMQRIASELGFSESVFIHQPKSHDLPVSDVFEKNYSEHIPQLRFFTPTKEIDACAHATLAAAHVVSPPDLIGLLKFKTNIGIVTLRRHKDGFTEMEQGQPKFFDNINHPQEIADLLGIDATAVGGFPLQIVSTATPKLIIPIKSLDCLFQIQPNFDGIKAYCEKSGARGFYPFTFETQDPRSDFHARQFNPLAGINEDPVTGVAAGALVAYIKHYDISIKTRFVIEQGAILQKLGLIYARMVNGAAKVGGYAIKHSECTVEI